MRNMWRFEVRFQILRERIGDERGRERERGGGSVTKNTRLVTELNRSAGENFSFDTCKSDLHKSSFGAS